MNRVLLDHKLEKIRILMTELGLRPTVISHHNCFRQICGSRKTDSYCEGAIIDVVDINRDDSYIRMMPFQAPIDYNILGHSDESIILWEEKYRIDFPGEWERLMEDIRVLE